MSLRLYKSTEKIYDIIKIVEHDHKNLEALNKISDIDNEPYYNNDKILTSKDNIENTMLQYNFTNIKANKKISITPLDEDGNKINLHDNKVIVQNYKRNNESESNVIVNIMNNSSANKNEWVYDKEDILYNNYLTYNTTFNYSFDKESSEGLYQSEEIDKSLFKDFKSIDNYNLADAVKLEQFNRVDVLKDCEVISIKVEGGGSSWSKRDYTEYKDVFFDNNPNTGAKVSQLDISADRTFTIDLKEVKNVCAISCLVSALYIGTAYIPAVCIKMSDDGVTYEDISFETTVLNNGELVTIFKKPINKRYFKFRFDSTNPYGCDFKEIQIYNNDISQYRQCIIKSNDKYIVPSESEYDANTKQFKEYDKLEDVINKMIEVYSLTDSMTIGDETFKPINKLPDKFSLLKKKPVPFSIQALRTTYIFYFKDYYSLDNLESINGVMLENGGASIKSTKLKCLFSFNYGVTWMSYNFDTNEFVQITDDIRLTGNSLKNVELQNIICTKGIDPGKFKDISFDNIVINNFKILCAFDTNSYDNSREFTYIRLNYNTLGSFVEMINEKEYFTTLKNDTIEIIPTISINQMKTNIVIRDKGNNIINVNTVNTDELVQLIKNNIELGLISPKDLSLNYSKEFTYDTNGNIIKILVTDNTNNTSYYNVLEYDNEEYLIKESLYDATDTLIGYKNITYDNNKNIQNIETHNYNNLLT